jgi:hypothetical protein
MQFVLTMKELWRRRYWIIPGVVLAAAVAAFAVVQLPSFKSRQHTVWAANSAVLVDAHSSAVGDLNQGLGGLIPRATVYANVMTTQALVNIIGHASGIPSSEISVAGPIGTNGKRPAAGASAQGANYSLQLDTDITQPTIRITADAPTSKGAIALANGAATGLDTYVTQLEDAQQVTSKHRVDIRQLGSATDSPSTTGIAPALGVPIFLALAIAWCMFVLFVTRFAAAWRDAPAGSPAPRTTEDSLEFAAQKHRREFEESVDRANGDRSEGLELAQMRSAEWPATS